MKPLKVERPEKLDPDLPEALHQFPERLVTLGLAAGKTREAIAATVGVNPSTVGRWLKFDGLIGLAASTIIRLENALGARQGSLMFGAGDGAGNTNDTLGVIEAAVAMGFDASVRRGLLDGSAKQMIEFGENLRRAVLGVVHMFGYPLEVAIPAAREVAAKQQAGADMSPESWAVLIRERIKDKPGSGTFPSSGNIKLG